MADASRPVLHLSPVAGRCRPLRDRLGLRTYRDLVRLAQASVGDGYEVVADLDLMRASPDPKRGGRRDDAARRADLQAALADDRVRAIVALRGGAWLCRLLPDLDFEVLRRRREPLALFGFSEFTGLVNIAACYPRVRAYYEHDLGHLLPGDGDYRAAFASFLRSIVGLVERRGCDRPVTGRLVRGKLPARSSEVRVVGGCLPVLVTLLGSPFQRRIDPRGRWLALEDVDDFPGEIDRHLAQLKFAGMLRSCAGLLLGDFHVEHEGEGRDDQTAAVLELLKFHLPDGGLPIVAHCNFGHCHPSGALPINRPVRLVREADRSVRLIEPWADERSGSSLES